MYASVLDAKLTKAGLITLLIMMVLGASTLAQRLLITRLYLYN